MKHTFFTVLLLAPLAALHAADADLVLLRGLLRKVPQTHRYQVTDAGRLLFAALTAATHANASKLMELAA